MYCKNCGKMIDDNAFICVSCGVLTGEGKIPKNIPNNVPTVLENYVNLLLVLSIFFGFIGALIAGLANQKYIDEQAEGGHIDKKKDISSYMTASQKIKFIIALIFAIVPVVVPLVLFFILGFAGLIENM